MSAVLACAACDARYPWRDPRTSCACGGLLEVVHAVDGPRGRALRALFDRRLSGDRPVSGSGVWRFRELLLPGRGETVAHPEGNTRIYWREAVSRYAGVADLGLKHEGENPSGSFKDRGMTVAVTQALRAGASGVACASTG
ncbi:MAG: pyridoxal-phosphate dependent enzyme, partial [Vicinamibacteria bacterium]